ncbi:MAG: 6-hydroxymethylpterin diphosphokinase MptE-like protein, partial [bacterium]
NTTIISELASHPLLYQNWNGKIAFFTMKRNLSQWVEKIAGNFSVLDTGGTVSHSMVDFAYKIGTDPIILVGQDLAYTDMRSHASGTAFEKRKINDKELIEVKGINGKVYTDKVFLSMSTFFNDYFNKHQDREFIDATEGGVKFDNIKINDLKSVINQYCNEKLNINLKLKKVYSELDLKKKEKLYKEFIIQLNETYDELVSSIQITEKQIKKIKKALLELKKDELLTNNDIEKLELSFSKYENKLYNTDYIKYFVDRLLIPQQMKLNKIKNKYYINKRESLLNRAKSYLNFREKFLLELKESKNLIEDKYQNELN